MIVECERAIVGGEERHDFAFLIEGAAHDKNAKIAATGTIAELQQKYPKTYRRKIGDGSLVVPGFVNAHSHAYQILLRGWADDLTFERWRSEALYKIVPQLTPDDVFWVFCSAFYEMLHNGITTVVEFFYLNGEGIAHAEAAIRAAASTGIRLILARTWMAASYAPVIFRETIDGAARDTALLIDAHPEIMICPAPHSLHAASAEMIRAAVAFARERSLPIHIHVAEAEYEGEQVRARTGMTPVAYLAHIGAVYEGLVAVHGIYVDDEEKKLLGRAGASVVHNPLTNQYLGDGICDVVRYRELGVPVLLGTDANVHPSILEEMRAAALLQKVLHRRGDALDARAAWQMGTLHAASPLRYPVGDLAVGMYADFLVMKPDEEFAHPWTPGLNALVYASEASWITDRNVGLQDLELNEAALDLERAGPKGVSERLRKIQERLSF